MQLLCDLVPQPGGAGPSSAATVRQFEQKFPMPTLWCPIPMAVHTRFARRQKAFGPGDTEDVAGGETRTQYSSHPQEGIGYVRDLWQSVWAQRPFEAAPIDAHADQAAGANVRVRGLCQDLFEERTFAATPADAREERHQVYVRHMQEKL